MTDRFASFTDTPGAAARRHFAIVPDDDTDLPVIPKAIYCQEDGTIVIRDENGEDLPYAMTAGQILLIRGVRVLETGTTGTYYGWA
jgi:hypothetical protein